MRGVGATAASGRVVDDAAFVSQIGTGALARLRVGDGGGGCIDHATPACCTLHRRGLVDV